MSTTPFLTKVGSPPYVQGSGVSASSTRSLAPFTAIEATRSVHVTLVAGERDEAVVTTDDNLLASVVTDVRDGTLFVAVEGSIETRLLPTVAITASRPVDTFNLQAAAELKAANLDLEHLSATLSSASRLDVSGNVGSLELIAQAASTADLRDLAVEVADVSILSASSAVVRASGSVEGSCMASSTLRLVGEPASRSVETDVSSTVEVE